MADTLPEVPAGSAPELPRALVFEEGLVGCPGWRHFVLEPDAVGPAIQLLRCLDAEGVALYVTDPFTIVPDYEFEIADADAEALELSDPRDALVFEDGLIGCPTWRRFLLEPDAAGPAIQLMRCLDVDGVALYVTDPFTIVPDYEFEIADADAEALGLSDPKDALVLVVLTVRSQPAGVTANLLGPLVVNVGTGRGRQLVLASSEYSVRYPVHG